MIAVTIRFWGTLKRPIPRQLALSIPEPATVGTALREACLLIGGAEAGALEEELLATGAFLVNGDTVGHRGGLSVHLADGDTLGIVLAVSGG